MDGGGPRKRRPPPNPREISRENFGKMNILQNDLQDDLNIETCSWGTPVESNTEGDVSLNSPNLLEEQLVETRWTTDMTLGRIWEHLSQVRIVGRDVRVCDKLYILAD